MLLRFYTLCLLLFAAQLDLLLTGKAYPSLDSGTGLFFFRQFTPGYTTDVSAKRCWHFVCAASLQ
jgi:hypothetical protein